ncbi:hypothetical protein HID58_028468 [Brassica napus]|uniref:Ethylene insensitive 3-like DNA-binding domain-containing protein n=1 Tax=Brassica napus TaxID=3708 RepID=A0ABQ8CAB5_BRANA|nr:hypothetical protein HID58_028468 [Brassica napus]
MGMRSNTGLFFSQPQLIIDDDGHTDDEFDVDKLEKRIWRQGMRLQRLKERSKNKERDDEQLISKCMFKMMEVCNAQGFVYGIIPQNAKPIISASHNLQEWWKDKVRFDLNGPIAIAKHQESNNMVCESNEEDMNSRENNQPICRNRNGLFASSKFHVMPMHDRNINGNQSCLVEGNQSVNLQPEAQNHQEHWHFGRTEGNIFERSSVEDLMKLSSNNNKRTV